MTSRPFPRSEAPPIDFADFRVEDDLPDLRATPPPVPQGGLVVAKEAVSVESAPARARSSRSLRQCSPGSSRGKSSSNVSPAPAAGRRAAIQSRSGRAPTSAWVVPKHWHSCASVTCSSPSRIERAARYRCRARARSPLTLRLERGACGLLAAKDGAAKVG